MSSPTGRRMKLPLCTLPVGGSKFSSLCLFLRVSVHGEVRLDGLVRLPYSDRPKVGGGHAVPWSALNPRTNRLGYRLPPQQVAYTLRERDGRGR